MDTNDIVTNMPFVISGVGHLTPQQAAMTLREWIGVISIFAMALIHAYQIVVAAGGCKNIWGKFLNGESPKMEVQPTLPPKPIDVPPKSDTIPPQPIPTNQPKANL